MEFLTGVAQKETLELSQLLQSEMEGKAVKTNGAVHTIRDMGNIAFVVLRKREGLLQCVYEEGITAFDLRELKEAATVEVEGTLIHNVKAPGGMELCLSTIKVLSEPAESMPIPIAKWKMNTSSRLITI